MEDKSNYNISEEDMAAYIDGNVNDDKMREILSSICADKKTMEIVSLSTKIDRLVEEYQNPLVPMLAFAAANPENLCSFECEAFILHRLNYDINHWTLLEEAKANNWVREDGTPLHLVGKLLELKGLYVERRYDATILDLEKAVDSHKDVIAVIDRNVIDGIAGSGPPSYHAIYVTWVTDGDVEYLDIHTLHDSPIDRNLFTEAWRVCGNYMVCASRIVNGYNPQPINVKYICLDADLEELTEAIAENAHDIWARARMDEGWSYGPVRDDELKHHPDLVPYCKLPENEKEYDRSMAMNTLRLIKRLGYDINKFHKR